MHAAQECYSFAITEIWILMCFCMAAMCIQSGIVTFMLKVVKEQFHDLFLNALKFTSVTWCHSPLLPYPAVLYEVFCNFTIFFYYLFNVP